MAASKIRMDGIVKKHTKGVFVVVLDDHDGHEVLCKPSGSMTIKNISVVVGDKVLVELSPYDLSRGRILWRH